METASSGSPGFLHSLRTLGDGLVAGVHSRLELLSLELQEEKYRLIQTCFWIGAAMFAAMLALTFLSITLVYLFWDSARLAVLGGLTIVYLGGFIGIVVGFRRYLARQPRPFAATLEELQEDRACIRRES